MIDTFTFILSIISIIIAIIVFYHNFLKKGKPTIIIPNRYCIGTDLMYIEYPKQEMFLKITFPLTFVNKGANLVIIDRIYATFTGKETAYCEWETQQESFAYTHDNKELAMPFSIEKYSSIIKI